MKSLPHNCDKLYIRYTGFFHYSLFPAPCSLLPAPYSLFPIPCSLSNHDQSTLNNLQSRR
ncbi:hypothetical protein [Moorena sp. SIO4G3]|uniref:hypothetical protein n=1 Tax=Moorena sp. SIO4G3 TaxID=2607821 RepID=UPI00142BD0CD|nr:hypothetical protein [Moorena sp. SIO4G3]NEO78218.1 hypothetical protein [Moorena sp. SIO4G3]